MLRNIWQTISGIACCAILHPFLCGSSLGQADPLGIVFPNTWVGNIDKIEFNEPSGIVFHRARGTLFVVGDGGDICEIETDGTLIQQKHIRRADFKGITYDPSTGLLYVAIEGEEKIVEFDPEGLAEIRAFAIQRTFEGEMRLKPGGSGIEAITFVPDSGHPHGGTFYVANQSFDLAEGNDISAVFEVDVPLRGESAEDTVATITRYFIPGVIDLSGLHYDDSSDELF